MPRPTKSCLLACVKVLEYLRLHPEGIPVETIREEILAHFPDDPDVDGINRIKEACDFLRHEGLICSVSIPAHQQIGIGDSQRRLYVIKWKKQDSGSLANLFDVFKRMLAVLDVAFAECGKDLSSSTTVQTPLVKLDGDEPAMAAVVRKPKPDSGSARVVLVEPSEPITTSGMLCPECGSADLIQTGMCETCAKCGTSIGGCG